MADVPARNILRGPSRRVKLGGPQGVGDGHAHRTGL